MKNTLLAGLSLIAMTMVANADEAKDKLEAVENQMDYLKTEEIHALKTELIALNIKNACYQRMFVPNFNDPEVKKAAEPLNKACEIMGCGHKPKICE